MRGNATEQAYFVNNEQNKTNGAATGTGTRSTRYGVVGVGACEAPITTELTVNAMLRQVPPTVFRRLQGHLKRVELALDDYLYRPDEELDFIYFPETAVISEFQILDDGRTIEVAMTGSEGAVGLLSAYSECRAASWTQTCAPGTALKIQSDALRREFMSNEVVQPIVSSVLCSYIQQISQKAACNAHHSVEERFCTWLLMLQDRYPGDRLRLTQEHIARVLGVYRPSVTCIAQGLRDDGLIDYVRGYIIINDREGLEQRCCGCYSEFRHSNRIKQPVIRRTQDSLF